MQYNHDNMTGVTLAADLVNAVSGGRQSLSRVAVQDVLLSHEIRRAELSDEHLHALAEWADLLREVFSASATEDRTRAANVLLTEGTTRAYLTTHDGWSPHLHFTGEDEDIAARVKAVTAGGIAIFLVESGGERLGVCARTDCGKVFVDTSRNGRRTYCSARCGNNDAVSRHRRRQN